MEADALVELFAPFAAVTTRRMFSGHGVYRDGLCFAIAIKPGLFLKADGETRAAFEAAGCHPFVYERKTGLRTVASYWSMPERAFDEPEVLVAFCALAEAAARRAAAKKRPKERHKPRKEKATDGSAVTSKTALASGAKPALAGAELDAVFDAAVLPPQAHGAPRPKRKPPRG